MLGQPFDIDNAKRLWQIDLVKDIAATLVLAPTLKIRREDPPPNSDNLPDVCAQEPGYMRSAGGWELACAVTVADCAVLAAQWMGSFD